MFDIILKFIYNLLVRIITENVTTKQQAITMRSYHHREYTFDRGAADPWTVSVPNEKPHYLVPRTYAQFGLERLPSRRLHARPAGRTSSQLQ